MKYTESNIYRGADLGGNLKRIVSNLLAGRLVVEGQTVEIPEDLDLDTKVKYATDEQGGNVTIKISWDNLLEEEVAEEDEF